MAFIAAQKHIKDGMKCSNEQVRKARLTACYNCSFSSDDKTRCKECGCFIKLKIIPESQSCPKLYW